VRIASDYPVLYRVLGRKIAAARANQPGPPLSQSGLAKKVGLTRGSIANIELGTQRAPLHVIWAIARALGREASSLLPLSTELDETLPHSEQDIQFDPAVARVVESLPMAQAWLRVTRTRLDAASKDRPEKRRRT
jgi:transcriptional regulator with XRE-family HTH domain